MLKVSLIGCGAIGTAIAKAIDSGKAGNAKLSAVFDSNSSAAQALSRKLKRKPRIAKTFGELLRIPSSLIVEAASQEAVKDYAEKALSSKRSVIIMSAGALADERLVKRLKRAATASEKFVCIPTGAVLGVDALKAAGLAKISSVQITTCKPPSSLGLKLKKRKVVFSGSAAQAVKKFPQNINVAATLSLAGIGARKTKVKIIADPSMKRNTHELTVKSDSAEFRAFIENKPSPENPKTSYIAALSAISAIKNLTEPLRIGT